MSTAVVASACPWTLVIEEEEGKVVSEHLCGRTKSQKLVTVTEKSFVKVYFAWQGKMEDAPVFVIEYEGSTLFRHIRFCKQIHCYRIQRRMSFS